MLRWRRSKMVKSSLVGELEDVAERERYLRPLRFQLPEETYELLNQCISAVRVGLFPGAVILARHPRVRRIEPPARSEILLEVPRIGFRSLPSSPPLVNLLVHRFGLPQNVLWPLAGIGNGSWLSWGIPTRRSRADWGLFLR